MDNSQPDLTKNNLTDVMLDIMPICSTCLSHDYEPIACNENVIKFYGLKNRQEYIERFYDLSPQYQPNGSSSIKLAREKMRAAFEEGHIRFEWLHQTINGEPIPSEITLVRSTHNNQPILVGYARDLRGSMVATDKLRAAEERMRIMLIAAPLSCNLWDRNFNNIDCNQAALNLFGFENKEEYYQHFKELAPTYQPNGCLSSIAAREKLKEAFEKGFCRFEWTYRKLDGKPIPTEVTLVRMRLDGQEIVVSYIRDLTEIETSIAKMREADERTQIMLDATPLCCSLLDRNGRVIDCNQEAANLFDLSSKQEYIDHFRELENKYQPDGSPSRELSLVYIEQAYRQGYYCFEWMFRKLNGEPIPAEVTLVKVKYRGQDIIAGYTRDLRELKNTLIEMRRVEEHLRLARDAAEESTRAKGEFLANMSHEIRTPMNGILGLLHLTLKTKLDKKQRDYLEKTERSARGLLRIINDILDFSKIEAGKLDIEACEFRLKHLVNELRSSFEQEIKTKELYFNIDYPKYLPKVLMGDPLRLKQILLNIIGNAIKFTQRGGISIKVIKLRQNSKYCFLKFAVHDTGIGMTAEQQQSLFHAFSQGDASITRRYGGTGLGLAICKNLVKMMHGAIWVNSEYGRGSTFYFVLRFNIPVPKVYRQEDEARNLEPANSVNVAKALPLVQEMPAGKGNAHLLLAEDNEINQIIARDLLENAGYTLDIASNGQEALDMLASGKYALVLMDIQMPVLDGLSAVKVIRSQPVYANLPVIAMSAHAMQGDREKSLEAGMNDHLTKPIDPTALCSTLKKWLNAVN